MKVFLLISFILLSGVSLAQSLSGTYEFQPPEGLEGDSAIVQLNKDEDGHFSAQVTVTEETIKGTNVIVGENQFSFDIEVKTPDGNMSQAYVVQRSNGEVTLSILSELGGRSQSMTFKGKLVVEIEGTYIFPPPDGIEGDTIKIQLTKNDEEKFTVTVTVGDETIKATNIRVDEDQFSFDTEVKTQIETMSQGWKVELADDEVNLTVLTDVGGHSQSMKWKGELEHDETDSEN